MIRFQCTSCNTVLKSPPEYSGKRLRCSKCHEVVAVPRASAQPQHAAIVCICTECKSKFKAKIPAVEEMIHCPKCNTQIQMPLKDQLSSNGQTVRFSCEHCRQQYAVAAKYIGKSFACMRCKTSCTIPQAEPSPVDDVMASPSMWENVLDADKHDKEEQELHLQEEAEEQKRREALLEKNGQITLPDGRIVNKKTASSKRNKAPSKMGVIIFVLVFYVALIAGMIIFVAAAPEPPDKSNAAMKYAHSLLVKLVRGKSLDQPQNIYDVIDMIDNATSRGPEDETIEITPEMQVMGVLAMSENPPGIQDKVLKTYLYHGASAYLIESTVRYEDDFTLEVITGVYETEDRFDYSQIIVYSDSGEELAAMTDLKKDDLPVELELTASFNSRPSKAAGTFLVIAFLLIAGLNVFSYWKVRSMSGLSFFVFMIPFYRELQLSKQFDRGTGYAMGLMFLPFIFYPILALSEDDFN